MKEIWKKIQISKVSFWSFSNDHNFQLRKSLSELFIRMEISSEDLSKDATFVKLWGLMREIWLLEVGLLGRGNPKSEFIKGVLVFS